MTNTNNKKKYSSKNKLFKKRNTTLQRLCTANIRNKRGYIMDALRPSVPLDVKNPKFIGVTRKNECFNTVHPTLDDSFREIIEFNINERKYNFDHTISIKNSREVSGDRIVDTVTYTAPYKVGYGEMKRKFSQTTHPDHPPHRGEQHLYYDNEILLGRKKNKTKYKEVYRDVEWTPMNVVIDSLK